MSGFVIPGSAAPNNLRFSSNVRASLVESDVYNICERIREVDPSLFLVLLEQDDKAAYAVMETCRDGTDRLVCKVQELDARIVEKVERLKSIPFEVRFKAIEEQIDREEAEQRELEKEELYETLGAPMLSQLEHDGFIEPKHKLSLTPSNKTAQRHRS